MSVLQDLEGVPVALTGTGEHLSKAALEQLACRPFSLFVPYCRHQPPSLSSGISGTFSAMSVIPTLQALHRPAYGLSKDFPAK